MSPAQEEQSATLPPGAVAAALSAGYHNLLSSFRYKQYRWYWAGNTLAHVTFLLQAVVLGWAILVLTDSAFLVGMTAFMYGSPC